MNETLIFLISAVLASVGICWYIMREKIKNVQTELNDKKVIIKELTDYTSNVSTQVESVSIKKPKAKTEPKKVKETKKKVKKEKIWSIVRNGKGKPLIAPT